MPFPMKIQPIDSATVAWPIRADAAKAAEKSRFKRLFERQFPNVLKSSVAEKNGNGGFIEQQQWNRNAFDFESISLTKMVQNYMEGSSERPASAGMAKYGRNRCSYLEDELDFSSSTDSPAAAASSSDFCEILKSLIPCASVSERNLLADAAKIIEENKIFEGKDDCRRIVTDGLVALGYDASICKSRWEKSPSLPPGEYEYVDAIVEGERLLIDVDFRSEFEIARPTGNYRAILQSLPSIFVGKPDRLQQIVAVVSEAAKQSLKKEGLYLPPWRKLEYVRAKWLSPYQRQG